MKRFGYLSSLFVLIVIVFSISSPYFVSSAANTDIIIKGYSQDENKVKANEKFTFTMTYQLDTGVSDLYVSVDNTSAFYMANDEDQVHAPEKDGLASFKLVYKGTGNELTIVFNYNKDKDGDGELEPYEIKQTVYLSTYEKKEDNNQDQFVDTKTQSPNLRILGESLKPKGEAGKNMSISLPIKNVGSYTAYDVTVSIDGDSENFPFLTRQISLSRLIEKIDNNDTETVSFDLAVKPQIKTGTYAMKVNMHYSNTHGDSYTTSENIFVELVNNDKAPRLIMKSTRFAPELPVPGDKFNMFLELQNTGTINAEDIKITLGGFKDDGIIPEGSGTKYLGTIEGGKISTVYYLFTVSKYIKAENYPVEIEFTYKDAQNNEYKDSSVYYVPIKAKDSGKASIKIENISTPSKNVKPEQDFKIAFDLVNTGTTKASDVKLLISTEKDIICKSLNTIIVDSLEAGEKKHFEFVMSATKAALTQNYPVAVNVEYTNSEDKEEKQTAAQYIGVMVEGEDNENSSKSVPKLIIDRYSLSEQQIAAGEGFDIKFSIYNTHKNIDTSNIKVSFSSDEGIFLPAANSNNSIFIENINAKSRLEKTFSLSAKFDAPSKVHLLHIDFEYEDDKGNPYTAKEVISIPVVQTHRLVINEISLPPEVFSGQPLPIMVEFYNMGKSTLNNLMVKYEGDMESQGSNFFVGNFEPGRSEYYEVTVIPSAEGEAKGSIVFTFEDSTGKNIEEREDFKVTVNSMPQGDMFPGMEGMEGAGKDQFNRPAGGLPPILKIAVVLGVLLIIAGIIVFIVVRRRKAAKAGRDLYENY